MRSQWPTALRNRVRERDQGLCAGCGTQCSRDGGEWTEAPWHMDHITALADGGSNEMENLQTLCVPCHKAKTRREAAARAAARARLRA